MLSITKKEWRELEDIIISAGVELPEYKSSILKAMVELWIIKKAQAYYEEGWIDCCKNYAIADTKYDVDIAEFHNRRSRGGRK